MRKVIMMWLFLIQGFSAALGQTKTLQFYLDIAVQNSPLLKDYRNQVNATLVDSLLVRANYQPQVAGSSINSYAPIVKTYGYDQAITNGGALNAVVGVSQAFAGKKNLDAQYRSIHLLRQGIENASAISEQELKKTISDQYITAFGTLQQLNFTRQINELLTKEATILKKLTEKNVYRQTDYLTFLVTLQQQQLTARQQLIQFKNDFSTLNYLAGIFDTTTIDLEAPALSINEPAHPENSIFFLRFKLDSLTILNEKLLLDVSYKPKLGAYADAGYNSSLAYNPYKNFGAGFGLNLTVPIYDGKKKRLQYTKLTITQATTSSYRDFAKSQYYQQLAQLKQQFAATENLMEEINNQVRYSQSLIDVNNRLLETGDAKIADLIIALNNYLNAKNLLTQNTVSRLQLINQINYWNR